MQRSEKNLAQGVNAANNKKLVWGVRTISLQARALPGTSILRTLIIRPPMISTLTISTLTIPVHLVRTHIVSTLTISMLMILGLTVSTHLVSVRTISTHTISTLTISMGVAVVAVPREVDSEPRGSRGSLAAVALSASDPHPTPWQSWQSWQSFLKSILRVAVVAVIAQVDFATFYSTMAMLAVGLWQCGNGGIATNIVWRIPCSKPISVTYATNATALYRSTATALPHWAHSTATAERPHAAVGRKFRVRWRRDDLPVAPMWRRTWRE